MRAVSEMWCVIVGPIVICEHLCRFHAVAVSCCGGMLHLWSCVLDTCVGGRPRVAHTTDTKVSFRTCLLQAAWRMARGWNGMGLTSSRSGRRSAREARMPHDCHVAPRPLARPLGPAYKHHARHAQRHRTRSRSHSPSTHAGAGGWVIKTERASHDARSERDVVCDCWTDCDL